MSIALNRYRRSGGEKRRGSNLCCDTQPVHNTLLFTPEGTGWACVLAAVTQRTHISWGKEAVRREKTPIPGLAQGIFSVIVRALDTTALFPQKSGPGMGDNRTRIAVPHLEYGEGSVQCALYPSIVNQFDMYGPRPPECPYMGVVLLSRFGAEVGPHNV